MSIVGVVDTNKLILINLMIKSRRTWGETFPRGIGRLLIRFVAIARQQLRTRWPSRPSSICSLRPGLSIRKNKKSTVETLF